VHTVKPLQQLNVLYKYLAAENALKFTDTVNFQKQFRKTFWQQWIPWVQIQISNSLQS